MNMSITISITKQQVVILLLIEIARKLINLINNYKLIILNI